MVEVMEQILTLPQLFVKFLIQGCKVTVVKLTVLHFFF